MIEERSKWTARCNKCNKIFEVMGMQYVAGNKCSLDADLKTQGWEVKNNNCWCPDCKGGKV